MEIKRLPIWKQALDDFFAEGFHYGQTLTRAWLLKHFELREPSSVEEYKRFQIRFLVHMDAFRTSLLENHKIDLKCVRGTQSYLIIPPQRQTSMAMGDCKEEVSKALRRAIRRVNFIDLDALSEEQRRENTDAACKLDKLKQMAKPKLWLQNAG